ncbi:MAG: hypothetical protein K1X72_01140 [Pyrinomonadaceae bacterium]|nr:hypothetical protein [Pyrinomonadaceae bacterium]
MDNRETNLQPSGATVKREIIILTFIFSGVSTFFTILFAKTALEPVISLATAIVIGIFILWWCKVDSLERNYELKTIFRFLIVLFGAFALIFYLFKTRGFSNGLIAFGYVLLILFGLMMANVIITIVCSMFFTIEM